MVTHELDGMVLEVAEAWEVQPAGGGLQLRQQSVADMGPVIVTAGSGSVDPQVGLDDHVDRQLALLPSLLGGLRLLDDAATRLDAHPARRVLLDCRQGIARVTLDIVWCVADGAAHSITGAALAPAFRYLEALLEAVLAGVSLTDASAGADRTTTPGGAV